MESGVAAARDSMMQQATATMRHSISTTATSSYNKGLKQKKNHRKQNKNFVVGLKGASFL